MSDSHGTITAAVEARVDGARVARITVDRQTKLNIVDSRLCAGLRGAVNQAAADPEVRAIVLSGAGTRAFIGGADITEMVNLEPESAAHFITGLHEVCAALRAAPVPVIARIQGHCLGAGLEVAASCDIRVCSDDAKFAMPEVQVGIPSVIEAALLPGLIGWGKTRELLFTGATFDAAEALSCGLVEKVVPVAELDTAVETWLDGIIAAGPKAIRAQKALINQWQGLSLEDAIDAGIDAFAKAYESDEPRTMMRAFLDRRR